MWISKREYENLVLENEKLKDKVKLSEDLNDLLRDVINDYSRHLEKYECKFMFAVNEVCENKNV